MSAAEINGNRIHTAEINGDVLINDCTGLHNQCSKAPGYNMQTYRERQSRI